MKEFVKTVWTFLKDNVDQFSSLTSIVTIIGAIVGLSWINKLFIRRKLSLNINSKSDALFKNVTLYDRYVDFMEKNVKKNDWIVSSNGSKLKPEVLEKLQNYTNAYSFKIRVINQGNTNCENVSIILKKVIISQKGQNSIKKDLSLNELPKSCQDDNYQLNKEIIKAVSIVKKSIEDFDFALVTDQQSKIYFINQQCEEICLEEGKHYTIIASVRENHIGAIDWKLDFDYQNGEITKTKASKCHTWNN